MVVGIARVPVLLLIDGIIGLFLAFQLLSITGNTFVSSSIVALSVMSIVLGIFYRPPE